eukprot:9377000-Karenia_brevis.AAC.1
MSRGFWRSTRPSRVSSTSRRGQSRKSRRYFKMLPWLPEERTRRQATLKMLYMKHEAPLTSRKQKFAGCRR